MSNIWQTETLLSGFPVPMLPYMLEERLHNDPSQTLETTNRLLSIHALVAMVCSPVFAKFFDKYPGQKVPLYLSLGLCLAGTAMVACPIRCNPLPQSSTFYLIYMF